MLFINLPVRDLATSIGFYEALGFRRKPQFSDKTAACIMVSDVIHVMLLTHAKFMQLSPPPITDAHASAQALFCLSAESRAGVDERVAQAIQAGGTADPTPTQEFGFMYGRSTEDPDGRIWEVMWMNPAAMAGETA